MTNVTNLFPCKLSSRDVQFVTGILETLATKYEQFPDQYSNGHDAAEEARSLIAVLKQMQEGVR